MDFRFCCVAPAVAFTSLILCGLAALVPHSCFAIPDSSLLRLGAVPACAAAASHWPAAAAPAPELLSPRPSALSASRRCSSSHCSRRSSFRASFSSSTRSASARASSSALARSASALTRSSSARLASASWLYAPRRAAGQMRSALHCHKRRVDFHSAVPTHAPSFTLPTPQHNFSLPFVCQPHAARPSRCNNSHPPRLHTHRTPTSDSRGRGGGGD